MTHPFPRGNISLRAALRGFKPALNHIDARLKRAHPEQEDEPEKIKKPILLLFGPEPIGFHSPPTPPTEPLQPSRPATSLPPPFHPSSFNLHPFPFLCAPAK